MRVRLQADALRRDLRAGELLTGPCGAAGRQPRNKDGAVMGASYGQTPSAPLPSLLLCAAQTEDSCGTAGGKRKSKRDK